MRRSLSRVIIGVAAVAALVLTVVRPEPTGLIPFGFGDQEVRAAPGQTASAALRHNLTALDVFNVTLVRIRDAYVDPARIDPKKMLYSALDSVQFNIPEVLVEPDLQGDQVTVVVNDQKRTFETKDVDSAWRLSAKLKKIFRFIEAHMNPGADLAKVEYAAVNGMLSTLDPHSVLLDPETAREMDVSTSGKFGGLGIVIRMIDRKLTIVRPLKGTPAWDSGLKAGDHIVKIDNEVTENLTLNEAVERMRGAPNTPITLWIERDGGQGVLQFDLSRAVIRIESVLSRMLGSDVGYIRIKQFSGRTAVEVKDAMRDLRGQGAKAWVLDLRWNPGGLLEQAIKVADLFVDNGTIVTTVGGREREPRRADRKGTDDLPVAVLVNGGSASASEIVAGALKNLDRSLIIGSGTFGKGSVQVLYDNKDGSKLKLTIAQYLTPGDRSIQSLGIVPDVELQRTVIPAQNATASDRVRLLPPSRSYREADLDAHLTSTYAKAIDKPSYQLAFLHESPKAKTALGAGDDAGDDALDDDEDKTLDEEFRLDFEIELARDLIRTAGSQSRTQTVRAAKRFIAAREAQERAKMIAALAGLGVDWSAPPADAGPMPALTGAVVLKSSGSGAAVNAGDTVELTGTVTNNGPGPAYQVHARVKSDDRAFEDSELVFGRIDPGQTRTWTTHLALPKDSRDRIDELAFETREARGAKLSLAPVRLRVVAAERPVFAYSHQLIDDGNGDGLVQKREQHRLRVTVKNIGKGTAAETSAILRNASGDGVALSKARFELGALKPGEDKTVEFVFQVTGDLEGDEAVVELTVYDAVLHESVGEKLRYRARADAAGPAAAGGRVAVKRGDVAIYEGASDHSGRVATAPRGAVFAVTGKQSGWLRIELENGRPGFVREADVRSTTAPARAVALRPNWQVTPPSIALRAPEYATAAATYKLQGKATDDTHVEDVYVFVSNAGAKIDNKKVFYKSNRRGKQGGSLPFAADIPLWPGTNRVIVVARENDDVQSMHTMYIHRD